MDIITTPAGQYTVPATSIVHNAQASLTDRSPASVVHLTQYDTTMPIIAVALTANGQPYTVPSGAAVNVRLAKPDGTFVYNPAYGLSDNSQTVYIAVTAQMTVIAGKISPIVEVVLDGAVAGTGFFVLDIDPNPIPEDAIESTDEFKTIQQLAAEVTQAAQVITDNMEGIQYVQQNSAALTAVAQNASNISAVGGSIDDINTVAGNLAPIQTAATNIAAIQQAPAAATNAGASATLAESWAVGGTGTREGENTNNAQYWAGQAQTVAQGALGWYESESALQAAHPTGSNGQWAIIGSTDTIWTWDSDTSAWVNSGNQVDLSNYYTKSQTDGIVGWLYKATFDIDSWTPGSGNVTQTTTLVPVDGGPPVTSGSTLLACIGTDSTLPAETKEAMSGPAKDIAGAAKTLDDNTITVTLDSAPDVDVEIFFSIKQGVTPAVPPLDPVGAGGGMKLLWENPSPRAAFSAQTVAVDTQSYGLIMILCKNGTAIAPVIGGDDPMIYEISCGTNAAAGAYQSRNFSIKTAGVQFGGGVQGGVQANNAYAIPIRIYGIKL